MAPPLEKVRGELPSAFTGIIQTEGARYEPKEIHPGLIPGRQDLPLLATREEGRRFLDSFVKSQGVGLPAEATNPWEGTKYSDELAGKPTIKYLHDRAQTMGLDMKIVPVQDSPMAGAMVTAPGNVRYMILDGRYGDATLKELFGHEVFHERKRMGDPAVQALMDAVDMESKAAQGYMEAVNRVYKENG